MNINLLNDLVNEVYVNNCHQSFEEVLVGIDNIIEKAAQYTHERYDDKILNEVEDIQQEIRTRIYIDFIFILCEFRDMEEVEKYIYETAEEVLQETRG
jgi:6-pyruvoyl-tetrahydropterin synthase